MIYEFYYLDENNKECHYKGQLHPIWNKLLNSYWNFGNFDYKLHKTNGPSYIEYDSNNNILREEWFLNGLNHREDGRGIIDIYVHSIIFCGYLDGKMIRAIPFAERTKHLICNSCKEFCKQKCF